MRVGLAIETDSPGGAETMLLQLARGLLSRGHDVVALGPSGGEGWLTARFADLGIERQLIDFRGPFGLGSVPEMASVIRRNRLDVLHSHEFEMALHGALGARVAHCRHVITMHGGDYFTSSARRRFAFRVAVGLSRRTVVVSEALRHSTAAAMALPPDSFEVVHNGVADEPGDGSGIRAEIGVGPRDHLVLAVGNLLPVKGHYLLLQALAALPDVDTRVVLAIAGRGPEETILTALAQRLGISDRVCFLGFRSDVAALLRAADLFVMPSLSEGLPMAMIEAMLAGKAIVASDAGGIRELVADPSMGILVEPGEPAPLAKSIARLLCDSALRDAIGAAARVRALEHFTASAMVEKYLLVYDK